ncbi:FAD-dependent oxidoreductase [Ochrobactrum haematophilum]|uniref:FAD-dependent oxidoreductase n=1 Tax=Brucella haematophila TaxID=419474 RepID=A0ABX1DPA7_9HYPH|nr:FAD-dependent oxidoreductase [Brucella haematophila]
MTKNTLEISTDVLVVGGGPAGCWAAWNAAANGASVVLVEKGYVGTSGATAAGNTTTIYTRRGTAERSATVTQRVRLGQGFCRAGTHRTRARPDLREPRSPRPMGLRLPNLRRWNTLSWHAAGTRLSAVHAAEAHQGRCPDN